MTAKIPPGFEPVQFRSPFVEANGPVYFRTDEHLRQFGVLVEQRHCNLAGSVHGGMLAMLADFAMGRALLGQERKGQSLVTLNLNLDYVGTAMMGRWIEAHVQVKKEEGSVVFATCEIREGERIVLVATGVFKFLARRDRQAPPSPS